MTPEERKILIKVHGALERSIGDTDTYIGNMTDEEIKDEEPVFWAAQQIAGLLEDGRPWSDA